ncbi:MAG TPA: bifunctional demethylmenaquinone methyltransferase/2-methoxy-6-polyprenyl-1,4-benzoquinol methylase UbiE [Cytophagaceae bacterium]|jgi:demethylmenaquinone methyltransferase/2-methoxy-6-polyprenyl-1,4-benzoquinol methylase|nr:bifunctional demethylmenaquinone methyltransferase/2-methoxy-6-polyprenyl-1,4-benzoquinol methylase UbiE [Cytophagaceae bacterium]
MTVIPYKELEEGKKEQVARMFNNISHRYDLLNRVLSLGIDIRWRKQAVKLLKVHNPQYILDVATGTGDFAIAAVKSGAKKITGVDISDQMLAVGRDKIAKLNLKDKIELLNGDSENLNFQDNLFDAVIVSFGVRNFENLEKGMSEILRVLKPGGLLIVLEFSKPSGYLFKHIYSFYFRFILPSVGKMISKDTAAYKYLPDSVNAFPYGKAFTNILDKTGFKDTQCKELTFGVSSIYTGKK